MPPDGKTIGFQSTLEEIKMFEELLPKTAPRMTKADRAKVIEHLTNTVKSLTSD